MGIRISKEVARGNVRAAYALAQSDQPLPEEWTFLAYTLREEAASRTFTPALCTALLARACDSSVDPRSMKDKYSARSYSNRTLCHGVLVPLSVELNFDLRATGREPLNNQPFFRYEHFSEVLKVKKSARPYFDRLDAALQAVDDHDYTPEEALYALAAVIRVCIAAANKKQRKVTGSAIVESSLVMQAERYVTAGNDVPRKLQACVAAGLDMVYGSVKSRRLNDPSRDYPGDVHVVSGNDIVLAVEVRGKRVSVEELEQFVRSVADADIPRAALVVDATDHESLSVDDSIISSLEQRYERLVKVNESISSFLRDVFIWSSQDSVRILTEFPGRMYKRMSEIEVRQSELDLWAALFADEPGVEGEIAEGDALFRLDEGP